MTKNIPTLRDTGFVDKDSVPIYIDNVVVDDDGFEGKVVFAYGAFRYDISNGHYLKFNSSLLWDEITGTSMLKVKGNNSEKIS